MNKQSYWILRNKLLFDKLDISVLAAMKQIDDRIKKNLEEVEKEVAYFYAKYGKDNVVDYQQAYTKLNQQEQEQFIKDFDTFVKNNPGYEKHRNIRNNIYKLDRLNVLIETLSMSMYSQASYQEHIIRKFLSNVFKDSYYFTYHSFKKKAEPLNQETINFVINKKWVNKKNFSERVWKNKDRLVKEVETTITDGIIRGDSYRKTANIIAEKMKVAKEFAHRLVFTESMYANNQGMLATFKKDKVKSYTLSAVLDYRTSEQCRAIDGKQFLVKEAEAGVNFPPFHPWCRTTAIPND